MQRFEMNILHHTHDIPRAESLKFLPDNIFGKTVHFHKLFVEDDLFAVSFFGKIISGDDLHAEEIEKIRGHRPDRKVIDILPF